MEGVDLVSSQNVTLIITVDCGISNFDEIAYAHSLGIDTIVLDHHISGDSLPPALAIIDQRSLVVGILSSILQDAVLSQSTLGAQIQ